MKRQVYIALFIAIFASTMGVGFIGPLLPFYARSLGAAGLTLGLIFSGFSLARFVFMPFIGRLSDRFGRKRFITAGLAIFTLFSFAYLKVDSIGSLLLVRFLHGAASGMVVPVAQAYIGDIAPKGREGSVMGTFMVFLFTAFGIGPLVAGPLADRFGLGAPFYAMGALSGVALIYAIISLPELGLHKERWKSRAPVMTVLKDPVVLAAVLFRSVISFGRGLVIPFLPFVAEARGASLSIVGVLLATNILLAGFMQIPFGKLADRVSKPLLMGWGIVTSAAVIAAIPFCSSVAWLFGLQIVTGISLALGLPAALALAAKCGDRYNGMGTVMAIFNTGMSVGLIVAPIAGGLVADRFGLDFMFFTGSVVVIVGGFGGFLLLIRRARMIGAMDCVGPGPEAIHVEGMPATGRSTS